jgi:hypothetical protein
MDYLELHKRTEEYLEWLEDNRDLWYNTPLAPLMEELYEVLDALVGKIEKGIEGME